MLKYLLATTTVITSLYFTCPAVAQEQDTSEYTNFLEGKDCERVLSRKFTPEIKKILRELIVENVVNEMRPESSYSEIALILEKERQYIDDLTDYAYFQLIDYCRQEPYR